MGHQRGGWLLVTWKWSGSLEGRSNPGDGLWWVFPMLQRVMVYILCGRTNRFLWLVLVYKVVVGHSGFIQL